jgi:hypothetical protein
MDDEEPRKGEQQPGHAIPPCVPALVDRPGILAPIFARITRRGNALQSFRPPLKYMKKMPAKTRIPAKLTFC